MITYDNLLEEYDDEVDIYEHPLKENPIIKKRDGKGFYYHNGIDVKGNIFIEKTLSTTDKKCILAEELGHHYTSHGNILDLRYGLAAKQERRAREWGAKLLINYKELIRAINSYDNVYQIAEELDVTYDTLICYIDFILRKSNI